MSAIGPKSQTVIDHEIAETIRRVGEVGATSFPHGDATGRCHRVDYVVRSQIVSVVVAELDGGATRGYSISIAMVAGPLVTFNVDDYNQMRAYVASLGCGDVALAGMAARP